MFKLALVHVIKAYVPFFYQVFIFSPNESPLKTTQNVYIFDLESSFCSQDIQIFLIFSLPFHNFQIQKDKWNEIIP